MIDFVIPKGLPAGARAQEGLARILETHGIDTARATVAFTDDNGPKGGRAMRCALGVTLPRRTRVRVEHTATTPRLALDGALDTLERELARFIERRRNAARHPKKYYAAQRLLGARPSRAGG
jgi:ribosome-associated translation inhibitor RaiA